MRPHELNSGGERARKSMTFFPFRSVHRDYPPCPGNHLERSGGDNGAAKSGTHSNNLMSSCEGQSGTERASCPSWGRGRGTDGGEETGGVLLS